MIKVLTTSSLFFILFILGAACNDEKDKAFDPWTYDGEYPRSMTGDKIKTFNPEIKGGEIEARFNGHTWNHAPFLATTASIWPPITMTALDITRFLLLSLRWFTSFTEIHHFRDFHLYLLMQ